MKKIIATISAIALVAIGTVFVIGQSGDGKFEGKRGFGQHGKRAHFGGRHKRGGGMMGRMFRQLDLTDAQKEQMKEIGKASREKMKPVMEQMRESRKTMQSLTANGNFDEGQVQAIAQQQGALHVQLIVEKQRTKAAMYAVLTDAQKAKLAELKQNFEQRRAERKAKWAERKAASEVKSN
ncbi:MAG: Spy/CpxP family protein refolding chaperone [Acidobacteriota bacterium]|nr:Spy/CpxP family protein refolding chaperone [Acidobacteriota bacterium]MDH3528972.1 Spy/CpxP family protein refolding chaperone [Acidobacteriota bacterium]